MDIVLSSEMASMSIRAMKKSRLTDAVCDYLDECQVSEFLTDLKNVLQTEEDRLLKQLDVFQGVKAMLFDSLIFSEEPIDETEG
jgi:hypothetical protein